MSETTSFIAHTVLTLLKIKLGYAVTSVLAQERSHTVVSVVMCLGGALRNLQLAIPICTTSIMQPELLLIKLTKVSKNKRLLLHRIVAAEAILMPKMWTALCCVKIFVNTCVRPCGALLLIEEIALLQDKKLHQCPHCPYSAKRIALHWIFRYIGTLESRFHAFECGQCLLQQISVSVIICRSTCTL